MILSVDLFFSFRSPYSYLALPKTMKLVADYDLTVNLRPVYPLAVRVPAKAGDEGVFLVLASGDMVTTRYAYRSRPATKADLKTGTRVANFTMGGDPPSREGAYQQPWWIGNLTDVTPSVAKMGKESVRVEMFSMLRVTSTKGSPFSRSTRPEMAVTPFGAIRAGSDCHGEVDECFSTATTSRCTRSFPTIGGPSRRPIASTKSKCADSSMGLHSGVTTTHHAPRSKPTTAMAEMRAR